VRLPPGAAGNEHDESDTGHEEVYAIVGGSGVFTVGGERVEVVAGDFLRVDPGTMRQPIAGPDGLRFLSIGGTPRTWDGRETL
jgi:mannose-6-phosphate isomerase-like protein (cupin superfamily)